MSRNHEQIRTQVLAIVKRLAPEIDPARIIPDKPLRTQIDLDSMDWLNFLVGIHKRLHVSIAEKDYASLRTLADIVRYVGDHAS